MRRSSHALAATRAALFGKPRRAARPALGLEALGDRIVPTPMYYPASLDRGTDEVASILTSPATLANIRNHDYIALPSPYLLVGHTLDLVGADGVTYGHVKDLSVRGTDGLGETVVSGLFTSGTTEIVILGTITPYAGGPTNFTANFAFQGYTPSSSAFAVSFHGTISENFQHASVSGSLAVYYPDMYPGTCDLVHETAGGIVYYEPCNTHYTPVSGKWF
jgi:hypothetical protein